MKFKISQVSLLNLTVVLSFLILPYFLFNGKLFLGGDDTRLLYVYPLEFIKNNSFFSWSNIATVGINAPGQFLLPFLAILSLMKILIPSPVVISYLAFSLPLIVGFIFFQKGIKELFSLGEGHSFEVFLGSLFYILSPIMIIDQYFIFLTTIFLLGLISLSVFLFLKFLKTSNFKYVFLGAISCLIFSVLWSIPWILGTLLPIFIGLIFVSPLFKKNQILYFIKRFIVFFGFIFLTQLYWVFGLIFSYFGGNSNSLAQKFVSQGFLDTFTPTILTTATSNILYPFLGFFHRQIIFDFGWLMKDVYLNYYDKVFPLGLIFIVILFYGLSNFKKHLNSLNQKIFVFLSITFALFLYLFTVNIGPLKELFIQFRLIPGFIMFRNFFDKFAIGYVLIYAALLTMGLVLLSYKKNKAYTVISILFFLVIIINFLPVKALVNSPLWQTKSIYRTLIIPYEYLQFMNEIKQTVPSTNTILSLPFGASIYSIIKDKNSDNVYVGTSPVKIFSGVSDIAGHYSFNFTEEANTIDGLLLSKDYKKLNEVFYRYNVNYVMVTKNIPNEVLDASWLFDKRMLAVQDTDFIHAIASKKIITSSQSNYELYTTKRKNSLIKSDNLYFKKISPVKYKIYIRNLYKLQNLDFLDSYHSGWKLFLHENPNKDWCQIQNFNKELKTYECRQEEKLFEKEDLSYLFKKNIFEESQSIRQGFSNYWQIDPSYIKSNYPRKYYKLNDDSTIDIEMILYFVPQTYFYYGSLISIIVFSIGLEILIKNKLSKRG